MYVCVCVCANYKGWGRMFQAFPVVQVFDTRTQSFFDMRKIVYLENIFEGQR